MSIPTFRNSIASDLTWDESLRYFGVGHPISEGDESILDSKRWGIKTYRIHALDKKDLHLYDDGLVICRIDCEQIDLVQKAISLGYSLCDTLCYWKGSTESPYVPLPPGYWMRKTEKKDVQDIENIALQAFDGYLCHYSADKRLDKTKIPLGYAQWAIFGEGVVIEHEKCEFPCVYRKVVAFGTFQNPCELQLAAVDKDHAGLGLYKQLVLACMKDGKDRGEKEIEISTQVTNKSVQRVWATLGLRPYKYVYTLHKWP